MKKILLTAIAVYAVIVIAGATAYFLLRDPPAAPPARHEVATSTAKSSGEVPDTKSGEAAKAPTSSAQEKQTADAIITGMKVENRGGITLYTYDYPKKPAPGVYLRPFLVTDGVAWALKFDLYYYYNISDPQKTAWIHGDSINVNVGGKTYNLRFLAHDRRDKMSPDAENLAESYVHDATEDELSVLRALAQAGSGSITYYQQEGGAQRSHEFTSEEITRIRNVLTLYDYETKDDAEAAGTAGAKGEAAL
ncbi:MAG: hypothetical protein MR630_00950 [Selenomonas sp.]|uniref:hypothetical protein n=1 Tax=Selenomonas sp. TaxID=2053611 RepID=UPI0025DABE18|nr:hypothetical protein [Selenomonas sp.]MCI6231181.1 hypothetical protein [Selenomonas sp.]